MKLTKLNWVRKWGTGTCCYRREHQEKLLEEFTILMNGDRDEKQEGGGKIK